MARHGQQHAQSAAASRLDRTGARGRGVADVIVVGAGPGGSATAAYLAMAGLDVLLLEKTAFPREKVCGDGLTPRAVRELITLGVPHPEEDGWIQNHGLRIIGGGHAPVPAVAGPRELPAVRPGPHPPWTSTTSWPATPSSTAPGCASAPTSPARCSTTAPARSSASTPSRSTTTAARPVPRSTFRAPLVVAADGNSSRGCRSRWAGPSATTGRWASPCAPTTRAPGTTTTTSSRGWSCGRHQRRGREDPPARLRLDLRRRRRHQQRRPRHPQHLQGVRQGRLQGRAAALGRRRCPRSGPTTSPR